MQAQADGAARQHQHRRHDLAAAQLRHRLDGMPDHRFDGAAAGRLQHGLLERRETGEVRPPRHADAKDPPRRRMRRDHAGDAIVEALQQAAEFAQRGFAGRGQPHRSGVWLEQQYAEHRLERDSRAVAAVEIDCVEPVIVLRAGADTTERQTVTVASLTLALLWDPKETGLAD
ncbi:MAG: hypothetical protein MUC86_05935 [Burkholderiaceae bacterium]|nr:hypothetical protein [Burkholderiaceae bacterium]